MTSIDSPVYALWFCATDLMSSSVRGKYDNSSGEFVSRQSLPEDPSGTTIVTFSGVTINSEIHVYLPDGTELTGTELCIANQSLTWPVYAPGSPNNTVSITIIKRGIRPQKFPYQSVVGNQTIPLFPQPDLGYNNPA